MSLTAEEQSLYEWASDALPDWYTDDPQAQEYMGQCAKLFGTARAQLLEWLVTQTRILSAEGASSITPDWLGLHARDRGTYRQTTESDPALRQRLRNFPDALTRPALLAAIQAILDAAGVTDPFYMLELPRDGAFFGTFVSETGTGGTFAALGGGAASFTPTVPFRTVPFNPVFPNGVIKLVVTGAGVGGNNGTFVTTGALGNGATFANGSVVAGVDGAVTWALRKYDAWGNLADGWDRAYFDRGYRLSDLLGTIIVILPYGTSAAVRLAIAEMMRGRKMAGVILIVERREIP